MGKKNGSEKLTGWSSSKIEGALVDISKRDKPWMAEYEEWFPAAAFKLLSESDQCKTLSHLCAAFVCSKATLKKWMRKYPDFQEAIVMGMEIGEEKWRKFLRDYSEISSAQVNNGLIKLLSSNVYGIKDEPTIVIQDADTASDDPEKELKRRGIPLPNVGIDDIDEEENDETDSDTDSEE